RHQTGEHHATTGRIREGARLRDCQTDRAEAGIGPLRARYTGGAANATRVSAGYRSLYVPGTGAWSNSGCALGYLEPGRGALRDGWRDPAVPGRDAERLHRLHPEDGATTFIRRVVGCSAQTRIHSTKGFAQKQR